MNHFEHDSDTCARCGADADSPHPIYDFVVSLEPVKNGNDVESLCQECQLRVRAKQSRPDTSDPKNSTSYQKLVNIIAKAVPNRTDFFC